MNSEPIHYAVIDVETTPLVHGEFPRTLFWGMAIHDKYWRFDTTMDLARFLARYPKPLVLMHHSNFDVIQLLLDGIRQIQFQRTHNGKFILLKWGEHTLINTYAIFPVKLKKHNPDDPTEPVGIFEHLIPGYEAKGLDDLDTRNYDDCVLGLRCFLELDNTFRRLIGVSPLERGTLASTMFKAAENVAGKLPKDLRYREAYRGGRCEVFDTRITKASKYDINSSYPYSFRLAPNIGELLHLQVNTQDWIGPLYDSSNRDLLLFPNGNFETWVYADTFDNYIRPNADISQFTILDKVAIDLSWLKRLQPLADKLYATKLAAPKNSAIYLVAKLGVNSIYGRIGLKGVSERCRLLTYLPGGECTAAALDWQTYIVWQKVEYESRSNYPIAAYITDNARGRLYEAFVKTESFYGDTDSTISAIAPEPIGAEMGQWKYEGTDDTFKANNLKDYIWNGKRFVKGGEQCIEWTTKRMANGLPVAVVNKNFSKALRKRILHEDGTTEPIKI